MPKNIVVLSDGTGQEGGRGVALNTNVYKLFNMVEDKTPRQIVFYDPGIGTGWQKVTGSVGGAGISRNIQQAYRFIFDNYEPGDRIFLIGFSRGAATVRSLSGFIHHFGILPRSRPELIKKAYRIYKSAPPLSAEQTKRIITGKRLTEVDALTRALYYGDLDALEQAVRQHDESHGGHADGGLLDHHIDETDGLDHQAAHDRRVLADRMRTRFETFAREFLATNHFEPDAPDADDQAKRFLRSFLLEKRAKAFIAANHTQWCRIEFLGCFDTVAALGLPFAGADAVVDAIPFSRTMFHDFNLAKNVNHAYHALAIDDEREVFAPVLWSPPKEGQNRGAHRCDTPGCTDSEEQTLQQVWFTGMHTDIGGGYEEAGLSQITLMWMLVKAHQHGLLLHPRAEDTVIEDYTDVMHDSRGRPVTQRLYRPAARTWDPEFGKPVIHESVLRRAGASQIRVWRDGKPVVVPGTEYQPWIMAAENGDFTVERWQLVDRGNGVKSRIRVEDLVQAQEQKWQDWMNIQRQTLPWLEPVARDDSTAPSRPAGG